MAAYTVLAPPHTCKHIFILILWINDCPRVTQPDLCKAKIWIQTVQLERLSDLEEPGIN